MNERLRDKKMRMELTDAAVDYLAVRPALHSYPSRCLAGWRVACITNAGLWQVPINPCFIALVQVQVDEAAYMGSLGTSAASACSAMMLA